MKDLNFGEYIRYLIVGFGSILIFYYLRVFNKYAINIGQFEKMEMSLIAITLVMGFIIYSIHRAVLYPILNGIILSILHCIFHKRYKEKRFFWQFIYVSESIVKYDSLRWNSIENGSNIKHLKEWGNQIHFLYCMCWILLFYRNVNKLHILNYNFNFPQYWNKITVFILIAAILHQIRCQIYEMHIIYGNK